MDDIRMKQTLLATLSDGKKIPALKKSSFEAWRRAWLLYKDFYDLPADIFDLTAAVFDYKEGEEKAAKMGRIVTYFAIVSQCGDQHESLVEDSLQGDAQHLWRAINDEYRKNSTGNITLLEKRFFALGMMASNLALKPFGRAVRTQAKIINDIVGKIRIDQEQEISVYLSGLTDDFNMVRATVLGANLDTLTISGVTKRVEHYAEYSKIDTTAPKSTENTYFVRERSNTRSNQGTSTSQTEICHFFKKHGWCRFKDKCKFKHVG